MKFNHKYMNDLFDTMLLPGEKSLCPIYCGFPQTGFFAMGGKTVFGYATCTNSGRLLIARFFLGDCAKGSCTISRAKQMKIKKNIFGQYVINASFPGESKDIKLCIQAASKVYGCDFPDQSKNLETMLSILDPAK